MRSETQQERDDRRMRRWWLAGGILFTLLCVFGIWAAAMPTASEVAIHRANGPCCLAYDAGRVAAEQVAAQFLVAYGALGNTTPPDTIIAAMAAAFTTDGVWGMAAGFPLMGQNRTAIAALLQDYWDNNYQLVNDTQLHSFYWDYTHSALTVEYTRVASVTANGDPTDLYDDDFVVTPYAEDTVFTQDGAAVFRFDCGGDTTLAPQLHIVSLRMYYDQWQRLGTYASDYPTACAQCQQCANVTMVGRK